jgi:hypothetical protein
MVSDMRLGQPSEEAVIRKEISRGMLAGALDNLPGVKASNGCTDLFCQRRES